MIEKIKSFVLSVKNAYDAFMLTRLGVELRSAVFTFTGIFVGYITLSPVFNNVIGTDLPTISQLKDVGPVALDALYRSLWITFLTETGLSRYRNKSN